MIGLTISKITLVFLMLILSAVFGEPEMIRQSVVPDSLVIPSLGINVPIIFGTEQADFPKALEQGVVHYPGTVRAGEYGNMYIFGHSSDNFLSQGKYKTIFARLPDIEIGAEIIIGDFVYMVRETKVVEPDDLSVLDQDYTKKILTLQTSYPVGSADKRFILIAELLE
jgi:sortase A